MKNVIVVSDLGEMPYRKAWDLQKKIQGRIVSEKLEIRNGNRSERATPDHLLFVEHPHVYTLGKSGKASHLLRSRAELSEIDAEYVEIDRGGDITYHGPGQIVGYPILDLESHYRDIHRYLRSLEEVIISLCSDYGIKAGRQDGLTGVWVGDQKICAMGIRCSRWVTMHGFALNVNTDLGYFDHIVPCGIRDKTVTSLSVILGKKVDTTEVKMNLKKHFGNIFNAIMKESETEKII
ncbi:MAG: lipoyl(octanoyl) transferase LipB [Balneolaceae bacterium]|nr:MAG: lipoyl(octanoyl) transferase LipB [Balneolaceae bacterium]